jgi:hypothetical protein
MSKIGKLYLDVHGVLADFVRWSHLVHEKEYSHPECWLFHKNWGISSDEFWEVINDSGQDFWEFIPKFEWADQVVDLLRSRFELTFLSAGGSSVESRVGTALWVERNWPDSNIRIDAEKSKYSGHGSYLIDDNPANCSGFTAAGGASYLFPTWSNARNPKSLDMSTERVLNRLRWWIRYVDSHK